eukprot:TRINITY_DN4220_c0_g1_i5.p1 TRINITY_DN4220_c0_g1~~TRINITY_DN4220_c0_g1_i5.p1  ORF type:complete len:938 (-),score=118.55 TRINITY_DN4220_c0_g1_i5:366-3179(-)
MRPWFFLCFAAANRQSDGSRALYSHYSPSDTVDIGLPDHRRDMGVYSGPSRGGPHEEKITNADYDVIRKQTLRPMRTMSFDDESDLDEGDDEEGLDDSDASRLGAESPTVGVESGLPVEFPAHGIHSGPSDGGPDGGNSMEAADDDGGSTVQLPLASVLPEESTDADHDVIRKQVLKPMRTMSFDDESELDEGDDKEGLDDSDASRLGAESPSEGVESGLPVEFPAHGIHSGLSDGGPDGGDNMEAADGDGGSTVQLPLASVLPEESTDADHDVMRKQTLRPMRTMPFDDDESELDEGDDKEGLDDSDASRLGAESPTAGLESGPPVEFPAHGVLSGPSDGGPDADNNTDSADDDGGSTVQLPLASVLSDESTDAGHDEIRKQTLGPMRTMSFDGENALDESDGKKGLVDLDTSRLGADSPSAGVEFGLPVERAAIGEHPGAGDGGPDGGNKREALDEESGSSVQRPLTDVFSGASHGEPEEDMITDADYDVIRKQMLRPMRTMSFDDESDLDEVDDKEGLVEPDASRFGAESPSEGVESGLPVEFPAPGEHSGPSDAGPDGGNNFEAADDESRSTVLHQFANVLPDASLGGPEEDKSTDADQDDDRRSTMSFDVLGRDLDESSDQESLVANKGVGNSINEAEATLSSDGPDEEFQTHGISHADDQDEVAVGLDVASPEEREDMASRVASLGSEHREGDSTPNLGVEQTESELHKNAARKLSVPALNMTAVPRAHPGFSLSPAVPRADTHPDLTDWPGVPRADTYPELPEYIVEEKGSLDGVRPEASQLIVGSNESIGNSFNTAPFMISSTDEGLREGGPRSINVDGFAVGTEDSNPGVPGDIATRVVSLDSEHSEGLNRPNLSHAQIRTDHAAVLKLGVPSINVAVMRKTLLGPNASHARRNASVHVTTVVGQNASHVVRSVTSVVVNTRQSFVQS